MTAPAGTETGDRRAFLDRMRSRAARSHAPNVAHPMPAAVVAEGAFVPIEYRTLDRSDLVGSFVRNAATALLDVHRMPAVDDDFLRLLIDANGVGSAVVSRAPGAVAIGERLVSLGVTVRPYSRDAAVTADLGVTAPSFGIAATGSLVQDSSVEGSRGASLVPRLHLAVVPAARIVGTTADVLATFTRTAPAHASATKASTAGPADAMPANVVIISGPSRTGDIEMILTVGVHGPTKVFVALVD